MIMWHDVSSDPGIVQNYNLITTRISEGIGKRVQPEGDIDWEDFGGVVWDLAWMSRTMGRFLHRTEDERIVEFTVRLPLDDDEPSTLFLVASGVAGLMFVTPDELNSSS